jgi:hypothetical protein
MIQANLRKARRRGLRRIKSAMTTAILGAALAASTVKAQQSDPSGTESSGQSTSSDRTTRPGSVRKSADDQVYGTAVTRGARYLMRNGLDYLNYKEYERALKFLREAETRKDELNKAEKQVLQNGIEAAKRGLRQAAGADAPYALSDRSHNRNGFSPAKPETNVAHATNSQRLQKSPLKSTSGRSTGATNPAINDADDRGEPILLANDNPRSSNSNSQNPVAIQSSQTEMVPVPRQDTPVARVSALAPAPLPPMTQTPSESSPVQPATVDDAPKDAPSLAVVDLETTPTVPPAATMPQPGAIGQSARTVSPAATIPPPEAMAPPEAAVRPEATAPSAVTALPDAAAPPNAAVPPDAAAPPNAAVPPDAAALPVTPVTHSDDLNAPAHKESEETSTLSPGQHGSASSPPVVLSQPTSTTMAPANELPPLPTNLGTKAEVTDPPRQILSPTAVPNAATNPVSGDPDELPPLPADVSNSARHSSSKMDQTPATSSENVAPAQVPATTQDPPLLPDDLSTEGSRTSSIHAPNTVQSSSVTAPIAGQNTTVIKPGVDSEVPLPNTVDHKATEEPSPSAALPSTNGASAAVEAGTIEQARTRSVDDNGVDVPVHPTTDVPNQEAAQESSVSNNRGVIVSEDASSSPPAIENPPALPTRSDALIPDRANPASTLRPELKREVEIIVRQQEDDLRRRQQAQVQAQPAARGRDTISSDLRSQTQLDISRAPSPAEARPIKAIPVPEDWVPLPPRNWAAQRKYWAAAATCHLPLYFQDPVLERYGHSVEQYVGPIGRYLTYPLDDPTQSTQRNQILQPLFSFGLFAFQIAALPYNVIMDPPWEAQYDLGYYRPGDNVPTDIYWLPLHGYGPPLRGSNY